MSRKMLKLLYRSFDKSLTEDERHQLDSALQRSANLRETKSQIEALRGGISSIRFKPARPFLGERVVRRLVSAADPRIAGERFWEVLFDSFRRVALIASIVLVAVVGFRWLTGGFGSSTKEVVLEDIIENETTVAMGETP